MIGFDVAPTGGDNSSDDGTENTSGGEQDYLGHSGVDANMTRDGFITANNTQCKAKTRTADDPSQQVDATRGHKQHPIKM